MFIIHWVNNKQIIPSGMQLSVDKNTYPLNIFMRIFIPYFISAEVKKVLYLDVDMIVNTEISILWHTNVDKYIVAAVTDSIAVHIKNNVKNYKELNLLGTAKIFQFRIVIN